MNKYQERIQLIWSLPWAVLNLLTGGRPIWGLIFFAIAIPVVLFYAAPFFGATLVKALVMLFGNITGLDVSGLMPYLDYDYLTQLFRGGL